MQILKELDCGQRLPVSQQVYDEDRLGLDRERLVYLVRLPKAVIYHMNGPAYRPKSVRPLRYGGQGGHNRIMGLA